MKFKVGDRVLIVGLVDDIQYNNTETVIVAPRSPGKWWLDSPHRHAREQNLRLIYDGNEKTVWDASIWVPEGVTV